MTYEQAVEWYDSHDGRPDWDEDDDGVLICNVRANGQMVTRKVTDRSNDSLRQAFADAVQELAARCAH